MMTNILEWFKQNFTNGIDTLSNTQSPSEWSTIPSGIWCGTIRSSTLTEDTHQHINLKLSWLDFRWRPLGLELLERRHTLLERFPHKTWIWRTTGTVSNQHASSGNNTAQVSEQNKTFSQNFTMINVQHCQDTIWKNCCSVWVFYQKVHSTSNIHFIVPIKLQTLEFCLRLFGKWVLIQQ